MNYMEYYQFDPNDYVVYDVNIFLDISGALQNVPVLKSRSKRKASYINLVFTFDIETSTLPYDYDEKEKIYTLKSEYINESTSDYIHQPFSFMYQWQFCYRNTIIIGRDWETFYAFMNQLMIVLDISLKKRMVVYVHNLAYEFQFIYQLFEWEEIFARAPHKVMKAITTSGIEFRCSYFLSNMSLEKFCENSEGCIHPKQVDDLDYRVVRTPSTILSKQELIYTIHDVLGLRECIDSRLKEDTLATIPMTSTGYVRRECREATLENVSNAKRIKKSGLNSNQYLMCKKAFRGGNTHANRYMTGKIIGDVYSFDRTSAYPFEMLTQEFPVGKFNEVEIDSNEKMEEYFSQYLALFQIELFDLQVKENVAMPYIDLAHCFERSQVVADNGRVLEATYVAITITSIDWETINEQYNYSAWKMRTCYVSKKAKLPAELRAVIYDYFFKKTQLKGVKEYEYMKSKNNLNSTFGMMVTAIDMDDVIFSAGEWSIKKADIEAQLVRNINSYNTFLSYQWGIFVTAYARRSLEKLLNKIGLDAVYIDTDCIKFVGAYNIKYFLQANKEILKIAQENDLPIIAENDHSTEILGWWDWEEKYDRFRTWGAKKYAVEKDGIVKITVSGMNKKKGSKAVKTLEDFELGRTFKNVGRTVAFYNNDDIRKIKVKGEEIVVTSNVGIVDTTYTLGITSEYAELIAESILT